MAKHVKAVSILVLGIVVFLFSSCATCKTSYRKELSPNPNLAEANASYKKAINWLEKAECSVAPAVETKRFYTTAESYLSDTIFKLKETGHSKDINVSNDVYYCEKIKRETDVKIGAVGKTLP